MMYCKFCGAKLEEGKTLCVSCGKENEEKKGILVTPGKLALSLAVMVVLVAVLVALIAGGLAKPDVSVEATEPAVETEAPTEVETVPPTTPADTGLDDVTNKGSYSADDETMAAAGDTVVATMGDVELTNGQLQVFYWMQIQEFLNSEYGYYASYLGLDFAQPLDTQVCMLDEHGLTWQQYFLKSALNAWYNYQVMAQEANVNGVEMDETTRNELDALIANMETDAQANGFANAAEFVNYMAGPGAAVEDYLHFLEVYYTGFSYFNHQYELLMPTDEEAAAYFQENLEAYAAEGITEETKLVDVRHVLLLPEGAPGVGTVLAVRVQPQISGWQEEGGQATAEGVLEATVLYMQAGEEVLSSAQAELPFQMKLSCLPGAEAWVTASAADAEAAAIMSDRLELRCMLRAETEERVISGATVLTGVNETPAPAAPGGVGIFFPQKGDTLWSVGRKYRISEEALRAANGGMTEAEPGKPILIVRGRRAAQ